MNRPVFAGESYGISNRVGSAQTLFHGTRRMKAFRTPTKTKALVIVLVAMFVAAPLVVFAHFWARFERGDYPPEADSISIPIFGYGLLVFPFGVLFLACGLRQYTPGVWLFGWNRSRFWWSLGWTALSVYPLGLWAVDMILDGIDGRLYGVSAFFILQLYCILVLRASVVCAPPAKPGATANGHPGGRRDADSGTT